MLLGVFWLVAAPFLFLTLYTTAQLQTAAKAALPQATAVPNIAVISHAATAAALDDQIRDLQGALDTTNATYFRGDQQYTHRKHQLRIQLIAINGTDPVDQNLLDCSSRDQTIGCFERVMVSAHRRIESLPPEAAARLQAQLTNADATFLEFLKLSTQTQELLKRRDVLLDRLGHLEKRKEDLAAGNHAALHGVAESYAEVQRQMSWFKAFFVLPDGAVVGLFTGVMGAIGAVVFSLYERLRNAEGEEAAETQDLSRSYITRPILGALAGFIVYFAMSVGSGVLLEAGTAARVEAGGLSTAALATLGLLAGLAVENALQWLTARARELFKS